MGRILKFVISPSGTTFGEGKLVTLLSCGYQRGDIVVWAEVEDWRYQGIVAEPGGVHVVAVPTGGVTPPSSYEFLGTVAGVEGELVFHLYTARLRAKK